MPKSVIIPITTLDKIAVQLEQVARLFREIAQPTTPEDQSWYWSQQWQEQEKKADADIAAGRVEGFEVMDDLIADLDA